MGSVSFCGERRSFLAITIVFLILFGSRVAPAQSARTDYSASVGASPYDLSGTGTASVFGLAMDTELAPFLLVESGIRFFSYKSQFSDRISYLLPEFSIKFLPLKKALTPYLAVGGGIAASVQGPGETNLALHTALGLRARLHAGVFLQTEARLRSIDPWTGSTLDLTFGIGRSF